MTRRTVALLALLLSPVLARAADRCECRGDWLVAETEHFAVWSRLPREATLAAADSCETLRAALCEIWCDEAHRPAWRSKCVVALHADSAAYAAAIGNPGNRSVGCTTLKVGAAGVTFRRIDLRCDASNWSRSALPHELTHVVLADRLGGRPLPLWADEGLAVLSEPETTRRRRDDALLAAVRRGATFPIATLLRLDGEPAAPLRDAFYGQSALIAATLIDRGTPAEFLTFLEESQRHGDDAALRTCYGLDGAAELHRIWEMQKHAATPGFLVEATGRAASVAKVSQPDTALAKQSPR